MPQLSFDPLDLIDSGTDPVTARRAMLTERDKYARQLRTEKFRVSCFVLRSQLRPYRGLGQTDGSVRYIFMLNASDEPVF